MALISIFTTATRPQRRGDLWKEPLTSFNGIADEVVIMAGDNHSFESIFRTYGALTGYYRENNLEGSIIPFEWPQEFDWPFIGQQFQRGYEACTGDWVIHADLDFIFHERDYDAIRQACEQNPEAPALSFWKYQFILPDRYNLKSRLIIAVNKKKYGDRIRFDSGGDLCQPSLDGKYISPGEVPEARVPFYNYDFLLKTEAQIKDDIGRMDRAYHRHFGKWLYSTDGTNAYEGWCEMVTGRFNKPQKHIKLEEHPKVMQETIKNLKPEQCGYSIFGNVPVCSYFRKDDTRKLHEEYSKC